MAKREREWQVVDGRTTVLGYKIDAVAATEPGIYSVTFRSTDDALVLRRLQLQGDKLIRVAGELPDQILNELDTFWGNGALYEKYGFLHRRGYLLYGPPGTGKTVVLRQIAEGMVKRGGIVLWSPCVPAYYTKAIRQLRQVEPELPVLMVMEDLDDVVRNYEEDLLSLADGGDAQNRVVLVATTNYIDRLPPRVIKRPRRFDRIVEITGLPISVRRIYFARKLDVAEVEQYALATEGLTFAALPEVILATKIYGRGLEETCDALRAQLAEEADEARGLRS